MVKPYFKFGFGYFGGIAYLKFDNTIVSSRIISLTFDKYDISNIIGYIKGGLV